MKKNVSEARVFALKAFTIKTRAGKFFVSPTGRNSWSGPYQSLAHATAAIARKLSREFTEREERLQQSKEPAP